MPYYSSERKAELLKMLAPPLNLTMAEVLDTQHRVIAFRELFQGTLDSASVYPREVVKTALEHNEAAVILIHNHPSGNPEPSRADRELTIKLKDALNMVGTRTLDHIVVAREGYVSLAELGYL